MFFPATSGNQFFKVKNISRVGFQVWALPPFLRALPLVDAQEILGRWLVGELVEALPKLPFYPQNGF